LIDVTSSSDRNVIQKEAENKLKYKNLSIGIQLMWKHEMLRHTITGITGIATKGLKTYLETISGKHSTESLHKNCTMDIARSAIIRSLKSEWWGAPLVQKKYQH
jgi:hypothetical protein